MYRRTVYAVCSGSAGISYAVLGLLEMAVTSTPYELKKMVDGCIGYFWDFPRGALRGA
jgi:hypothetical protein